MVLSRYKNRHGVREKAQLAARRREKKLPTVWDRKVLMKPVHLPYQLSFFSIPAVIDGRSNFELKRSLEVGSGVGEVRRADRVRSNQLIGDFDYNPPSKYA